MVEIDLFRFFAISIEDISTASLIIEYREILNGSTIGTHRLIKIFHERGVKRNHHRQQRTLGQITIHSSANSLQSPTERRKRNCLTIGYNDMPFHSV